MMAWLEKILGNKKTADFAAVSDVDRFWARHTVTRFADQGDYKGEVNFLLREIDNLMTERNNRDYWYFNKAQDTPPKRLEQLTCHYDGRIRQRAVRCLGLMNQVSALPCLIQRANDWVLPIRETARESIRHFIQPQYAVFLVNGLPDFFRLLNGERDDHQKLVDEVVEFLSRPENWDTLLNGFYSASHQAARLSLQIVLERNLLTKDDLYQRVSRHQDVLLRLMAVEALLNAPQLMTSQILDVMLRDSYALVKQQALQFASDHSMPISPSQLRGLLFDRNEIVRKRSARLLEAQGVSTVEHYLAMFHDTSQPAALRTAALLGLSEQKYEQTLPLALGCLQGSGPKLYKTALQVIVRYQQDEARDILLVALTHPFYSIAKYAYQQIVKLKLYLTLPDLQHCIDSGHAAKHIRLYLTLSGRLNIWDALIFVLTHYNLAEKESAQAALQHSERRINRFSAQPKEFQKEQLLVLFKQHRDIVGEDYLQRLLSS